MEEEKNSNGNIIELYGYEFVRTKNGLEEEQVLSVIEGLTEERNQLIERNEHLSSLTRLAEKTVAEADNFARQIEAEAKERAGEETKNILAWAEEQAEKVIQEKTADVLTGAEQEAKAIQSEARKQVEAQLRESTQTIQVETKDMVSQIYGELLVGLEDLKQRIVTCEIDFEQRSTAIPGNYLAPDEGVEDEGIIPTDAIVEMEDEKEDSGDMEPAAELDDPVEEEVLGENVAQVTDEAETGVFEKEVEL